MPRARDVHLYSRRSLNHTLTRQHVIVKVGVTGERRRREGGEEQERDESAARRHRERERWVADVLCVRVCECWGAPELAEGVIQALECFD